MRPKADLNGAETAHSLVPMTQAPPAGGPQPFARYRLESGFLAHLVAQHEGVSLLSARRRGTQADANGAYAANAGRLIRRMPPGLRRTLQV